MSDTSKQYMVDELERKRELLNKRLDAQRERINKRFDQKKAELDGKLNNKQEQIVAAALQILSEKGLNDLSLRDIAQKLTIKAPALYWYFKSKSELVDYMAEAILSREFADIQPRAHDETWQDWLVTHMGRLRKAMLAYPDGGRVVAGAYLYPAVTLAQLFENAVISLADADMDEASTFYTVTTAIQFTFGFVIEEQAGPGPAELADVSDRDWGEFSASYPNLARAAAVYNWGTDSANRAYAAGLQLIVRGAEAS